MVSLLDDLFLTQHVNFPTRYRNDQIPSLLDLILSTDQHVVTDLASLPPLGKSDHIVISFDQTTQYARVFRTVFSTK